MIKRFKKICKIKKKKNKSFLWSKFVRCILNMCVIAFFSPFISHNQKFMRIVLDENVFHEFYFSWVIMYIFFLQKSVTRLQWMFFQRFILYKTSQSFSRIYSWTLPNKILHLCHKKKKNCGKHIQLKNNNKIIY